MTPVEYAVMVPLFLISALIWYASLSAKDFNTRFICGLGFAACFAMLTNAITGS